MKKLFISLALIFALLSTCLVGCNVADGSDAAQKEDAAAVFTLDVNPGVRVFVKADNTVIAVEATNEDGSEIVAMLEVEGIDYEEAVDQIIAKMNEKGYLEGEESSVLISVEKKAEELSAKINDKINKAFEKLGKKASVIEQELDKLDKEIEKAISDIAQKYNISEGKAHLIEKIREEFPELSEKELAELKVNDLGMMLEDTSEHIKSQFKKIGKAVEDAYIGRKQALEKAAAGLEELNINVEDVKMPMVRVTREDGKMVYEASFVYDGMEYEITLDAKTGEIIEYEREEFEELDIKGMIDDFCTKNELHPDQIKDKFLNGLFGKDENKDEHDGKHEKKNPMTRGELLKDILAKLDIAEDSLKKTDVRLHESEDGMVFSVTVETEAGDVYKLAVEAYSGTVIKAELNGTEFEISVEVSK